MEKSHQICSSKKILFAHNDSSTDKNDGFAKRNRAIEDIPIAELEETEKPVQTRSVITRSRGETTEEVDKPSTRTKSAESKVEILDSDDKPSLRRVKSKAETALAPPSTCTRRSSQKLTANQKQNEASKTDKTPNQKQNDTSKTDKTPNQRQSETSKTDKTPNQKSESSKIDKTSNQKQGDTSKTDKTPNQKQNETSKADKTPNQKQSETSKTDKTSNQKQSETSKTDKTPNQKQSETSKTDKTPNQKQSESSKPDKTSNQKRSETSKTDNTPKTDKTSNQKQSESSKAGKTTNQKQSESSKADKTPNQKQGESAKTDKTPNQKQNETSKEQRTSEASAKKRGRPRRTSVGESKDTGTTADDVINLTDTESQSLFVPTPAKLDKSVAVSSPLNSLMDVKQGDGGKKMKRKSLKAKNVDLPVRSPIATRKRKSMASESETPKSGNGGTSAKKNSSGGEDEPPSKVADVVPAPEESSGGESSTSAPETRKSPEKYDNTQPIVRVSPIKLDSCGSPSVSPRKVPKRGDDNASPVKRLKFDDGCAPSKQKEAPSKVEEPTPKLKVPSSKPDSSPLKTKEGLKGSSADRNKAETGDPGDSTEPSSADTNCSVMIIEDVSNNEIISLPDTPEPKNATEKGAAVEDQSTFFESSENMIVDESASNADKVSEEAASAMEEDVIEECTQGGTNETANEKQVDEIENAASNEENLQKNVEDSEEIENSAEIHQAEMVVCSPVKTPSSPVKVPPAVRSLNLDQDAQVPEKETTPSPEKSIADPKNVEWQNGVELRKKMGTESALKGDVLQGDVDLPKSSSPISSNTRTSRIMRLAYDSHNIVKSKPTNKIIRSPQIGNGNGSNLSNFKATTINQRTKILMANGVAEKALSPNKM